MLLGLLPAIKKSKKFGKLVGAEKMEDGSISLPYWSEDEIVSEFFNTAYFLGIVVMFDWSAWSEGILILNDPMADFNEFDISTLCKLLTVIIRSDKFCEGYMINCFENGTVAAIIEAIQSKIG
jgi:hypothetical protein